VENDRYAQRVLGPNSRGKNQFKVLRWLVVMSGGKPTAERINDYVSTRQVSAVTIVDGVLVAVNDGRGQPQASRLGDQSPRPPGIFLGMGRNDPLA
jgi:hypothetical protein